MGNISDDDLWYVVRNATLKVQQHPTTDTLLGKPIIYIHRPHASVLLHINHISSVSNGRPYTLKTTRILHHRSGARKPEIRLAHNSPTTTLYHNLHHSSNEPRHNDKTNCSKIPYTTCSSESHNHYTISKDNSHI